MNCDDVATILDERREARLATAERCALDRHVAECEPCALAWHAQAALTALPVPSTPPSLLGNVLRAVQARAPRERRAASTRIVFAGALLATGAALAAVTYVTWDGARDRGAAPAAPDDGGRAPVPATAAPDARAAPALSAAPDTAGADQSPVAELEPFMVARVPPTYPPAALERKLEGNVRMEYTVAANGAVEDAKAVSSSDAVFEAAALAAVSQWKYLPRVVAGERVATPGVQTIVRFQLVPPPAQANQSAKPAPSPELDAEETARRWRGYEAGLETAWSRFAANDFRGAELELDELRATYGLDDTGRFDGDGRIFSFYGRIFTQYADYGRAIAAYESALEEYAKIAPGGVWPGEQLALANLYMARHQYDMALKTLLEYRAPEERRRATSKTEALIEQLRALGVTEETL